MAALPGAGPWSLEGIWPVRVSDGRVSTFFSSFFEYISLAMFCFAWFSLLGDILAILGLTKTPFGDSFFILGVFLSKS